MENISENPQKNLFQDHRFLRIIWLTISTPARLIIKTGLNFLEGAISDEEVRRRDEIIAAKKKN